MSGRRGQSQAAVFGWPVAPGLAASPSVHLGCGMSCLRGHGWSLLGLPNQKEGDITSKLDSCVYLKVVGKQASREGLEG